MKHFVIGAGATLAEAIALGNPLENCPPLIRDFARKTWSNYTPHPVLEAFLNDLGYTDLGRDPRELFFRLEEDGKANIEPFMEFAWVNRNREWKVNEGAFPPGYISGLRVKSPGSDTAAVSSPEDGEFWENLLYHGIGSPLSFIMSQCFFENGKGWKDLRISKFVASHLEPADMVLNLNYDTVFELALQQLGLKFCYSPNPLDADHVLVCKPHGSLNMVMNNERFKFGQPEWLGTPQPQGFRSYSGLIPPRLNKNYDQHPIATKILAPVIERRPKTIVMWGVGLTASDVDLIDLYERWSKSAEVVEVINPSAEVAEKAKSLFKCSIRHFSSIPDWDQSLE